MRKAKAIVLISVGLALGGEALAGWVRVNTGTLAWLHAVQFIDDTRGWAAGSNGTLLATADGGRSWRRVNVGSTDLIRDVLFRDGENGILLCEREAYGGRSGKAASYLLRTSDGGNRWEPVEFGRSERFARLFLGHSGTVMAIGELGALAFLAEGGSAREPMLPNKHLLLDASLQGSTILLVGGGGTIIRSDLNGDRWEEAGFEGVKPTAKLNALDLGSASAALSVGNNGLVIWSNDGGRSWRNVRIEWSDDLLDVAFVGASGAIAVGQNGAVISSADLGRTWTREPSGVSHRLERLAVIRDRVIAVGFGGTIIYRERTQGGGFGTKGTGRF